MTIRGYSALLALLVAVIIGAARLTAPAPSPESAVAGRFTGEQMAARAALLAARLSPDGKVRQWTAAPYGPSDRPGAHQAFWRVDGDEDGGRSGIHFLFDAQTGEMRLFSYSEGGDPPLTPAHLQLPRKETLRYARRWLEVFEKAEIRDKRSAASPRWKADLQTEGSARTVLFRSGDRNVHITLHPSRGALLRLSASSRAARRND
jgi:hypothetical protein